MKCFFSQQKKLILICDIGWNKGEVSYREFRPCQWWAIEPWTNPTFNEKHDGSFSRFFFFFFSIHSSLFSKTPKRGSFTFRRDSPSLPSTYPKEKPIHSSLNLKKMSPGPILSLKGKKRFFLLVLLWTLILLHDGQDWKKFHFVEDDVHKMLTCQVHLGTKVYFGPKVGGAIWNWYLCDFYHDWFRLYVAHDQIPISKLELRSGRWLNLKS